MEVLSQHAPTWLMQLPALLNPADLDILQRKTQGATRARMLREMAEALEALTANHLLVLTLEDLHWSDPSTLELLSFLARRRQPARLLVLGTYRPVEVLANGHPLRAVTQELQLHRHCEELSLRLLSDDQIVEYLTARLRGPSPAKVGEDQGEDSSPVDLRKLARLIHRRTEGNPLFMVTITDDLLARGRLEHPEIEVNTPPTLRQMIERQFDHLAPAERQVLEVASASGVEFSAAAVAAGVEDNIAEIETRCADLARRGQFVRTSGVAEWPDGTVAARYSFLHALYQEVVYERVAVSRRSALHQRIGERLEIAYKERAREVAAELAVHFEQGRDYRKAVRYLEQAGGNAARRSAHQEAINHLTKGLELLKTLPDTVERTRQELSLQIALGAPLIVTRGYGASEVGQVYSRARELCRQLGELPQLFPALYGLAAFYVLRGELERAYELKEQLLRLAQNTTDSAFLVMAHRAVGSILLYLGEFAAAREHFEQGLAIYDPPQHRSLMFLYGIDPKVVCLFFLAQTLWYLGYPQQALQRIQEVLALAQELAHPYGWAGTLGCAALVHQHCGDTRTTQARAEAAIALSTEQGFALVLPMGCIYRGWALAEQGHLEEGMTEMSRGVALCRAMGTNNLMPYHLALLVEVYGKAGQIEDGLAVLAEALDIVNRTGERQREAELYRLKGTLTLQSQTSLRQVSDKSKPSQNKSAVTNPQPLIPKPQAEADAEACFLKAIEIARKQQAKALELRATTSLARLWQQQGKKKQARQMLAEIYGWFTEGFDTMDLKHAKVLLDELE